MSNAIPAGSLGVFAGVLTYSIICLLLSSVLVLMLWKYGERFSYISLLSVFVSISTLASIIQQIHYAVEWRHIKEVEFELSQKLRGKHLLSLGGNAEVTEKILFGIQYYCYNVESLLILLWASALFRSSWNVNMALIKGHPTVTTAISRTFAIIFPALVIGVINTHAISANIVAFFIFANAIMLTSLTTGSVLLILVLYKYVRTRRLMVHNATRSAWWQPGSHTTMTSTTESTTTSTAQNKAAIYDRALITRFTLGFIVLVIFETFSILFQWRSSLSALTALQAAPMPAPDLSSTRITSDLLVFIPGVTASLALFAVFGTTKSARQYGRLFERRRPLVVLPPGEAEEGFARLRSSGGPVAREIELVERVVMFAPRDARASLAGSEVGGMERVARPLMTGRSMSRDESVLSYGALKDKYTVQVVGD